MKTKKINNKTKKKRNKTKKLITTYRSYPNIKDYVGFYYSPIYRASIPYVGRKNKNSRKYIGVGGNSSNKYSSVVYNSIGNGGDSRISALNYQRGINLKQLEMNNMAGGGGVITIPQFPLFGPQQVYNANASSVRNNHTNVYGKAQATGDVYATQLAPNQGIVL